MLKKSLSLAAAVSAATAISSYDLFGGSKKHSNDIRAKEKKKLANRKKNKNRRK